MCPLKFTLKYVLTEVTTRAWMERNNSAPPQAWIENSQGSEHFGKGWS